MINQNLKNRYSIMIIGKKNKKIWLIQKNNNMNRDTQKNRTPTFNTNKYTKTFVEKWVYCYPKNKEMK